MSGILKLRDLAYRTPAIPRATGIHLAHAAAVCLENQGHESGVKLLVRGDFAVTLPVVWSFHITDRIRNYWADLVEATEYGAYALALLLLRQLAGYHVIERTSRGTGFDWWLGPTATSLDKTAQLEVSGVLKGDASRIEQRMRLKTKQVAQAAKKGIPTYVAVLEFSTPCAEVICQ